MIGNLVINKIKDDDITLAELKETELKYSKLILKEFLDFIPAETTVHEIFQIKGKLEPKGILEIQGFDLQEISYAIVNDKLATIDYNKIIQERKQLLTIPDLKSILEHTHFSIKIIDIDAYQYLIEAVNET